ncbi:MAG: sulfatase-like hydrolase/transferase [Pirellulales bacterium]
MRSTSRCSNTWTTASAKCSRRFDRLNLADDTLVLFTSDNGGSLPEGGFNGPWRSGKTHMYEGGLRVPGLVRRPGKIAPGGQTDHVVLTMDVFATCCELAGAVPPAGIDGVSFLPTLLGRRQADGPRDLYFCRREGGPAYGGKTIEAYRRGPWKLLQDSPFAPPELYNLASDPQETTNLAAQEKVVFRDLSAALRRQIQLGGAVPWQRPEPPTTTQQHSEQK